MKKSSKTDCLKLLEKSVAESVSFNEESSIQYLEENGIDVQKLINKGLKKIENTLNKNSNKQNRDLFFKRVVLGAEIVNNLYLERTFGHVKFQKLMYLCEQLSNMEITNRYTKQAAGPYDARFMHSIDREFQRLKWFNVEVKDEKKFKTYKYTLGENIQDYKRYFNNYYASNSESIEWLIQTFGKPPTSKVELVATIYSCLDEFIKDKENFSLELLINKVYSWSEEKKKKFTKDSILTAYKWMTDNGLVPVSKSI